MDELWIPQTFTIQYALPYNHQPWITLVVLYPYHKENAVGIGKENITKPGLQSLEDTTTL